MSDGKFYMQKPQDEYGNVALPWYVLSGHFEERYGYLQIFVIEGPAELIAMGHPDLSTWPVYETSDQGPARKIEYEEYLAILKTDGVSLPRSPHDTHLGSILGAVANVASQED